MRSPTRLTLASRSWQGQTVKYDVTVKALKTKTYPAKDDELAKQIGDYESWADFEEKLRGHANGRKKEALESKAKEEMLGQWIAKFQFPVPETFVQQQIDARLDRGLRALAQQGMTADDMRKLDFARLRAAQREQSVGEVKASLILDRIADAEGIEVTGDEMEREILMASLQSRQPLETMREQMQKDGSIDRLREQMRREKTRDHGVREAGEVVRWEEPTLASRGWGTQFQGRN